MRVLRRAMFSGMTDLAGADRIKEAVSPRRRKVFHVEHFVEKSGRARAAGKGLPFARS